MKKKKVTQKTGSVGGKKNKRSEKKFRRAGEKETNKGGEDNITTRFWDPHGDKGAMIQKKKQELEKKQKRRGTTKEQNQTGNKKHRWKQTRSGGKITHQEGKGNKVRQKVEKGPATNVRKKRKRIKKCGHGLERIHISRGKKGQEKKGRGEGTHREPQMGEQRKRQKRGGTNEIEQDITVGTDT